MFSKILIANRGEIACRIIRTARAMNIRTIAVYSEADARARHVREADEAFPIGPSPARLSYLVAERLIAVARNDDAKAPADKETFRAAALAASRPAEIEVYPADHGWTVPDSPVYDPVQADRAWVRMLDLFEKL